MGKLEGKVIVVLGGGRGIGRATALQCSREGARLLVNDLGGAIDGSGRDPSVAEAVAQEIRRTGREAIADAEDLRAEGASSRILARAREAFGRVDGVIACAGIRHERALLKLDEDELDAVLAIHLKAAFAIVRAASETFVDARHGGAIVLCTGAVGSFGVSRHAAIAAAHAGVIALARTAALELRKHGIRVNAVAPTARTRLTEDLPLFRGIAENSMTPEHVAPVMAFLVSDLATDISGEVVGVAGSRVYAIRSRETTGAVCEEGAFTTDALRARWPDIVRGTGAK